jgi:hypothetical protein
MVFNPQVSPYDNTSSIVLPALCNAVNKLVTTTGYTYPGLGTGGTVTQLTSITTPVTLNTMCGQITTVSNAFVNSTLYTFVVNNSLCTITDCVVVNITDTNQFLVWAIPQNGSFNISIFPLTTATGPAVLTFAIIKVVTS